MKRVEVRRAYKAQQKATPIVTLLTGIIIEPPLSSKAMAMATEGSGITTDDVNALCKKALQGTGVKFLGVVPAHELPPFSSLRENSKRPMAFVANTHTKDRPGEHWVAFWLPKTGTGKPFMFDSFARSPEEMGHPDWRQWLNAVTWLLHSTPVVRILHADIESTSWGRQKTVVQDESSDLCGPLCAFYLAHVSRNIKFAYDSIIPETVISRCLFSLK